MPLVLAGPREAGMLGFAKCRYPIRRRPYAEALHARPGDSVNDILFASLVDAVAEADTRRLAEIDPTTERFEYVTGGWQRRGACSCGRAKQEHGGRVWARAAATKALLRVRGRATRRPKTRSAPT